MKFYVYLASIDGDVKYVGKGKDTRFQHVNSGISSCYMANKAHFEGKFIDVDFYKFFELEEDALLFEKEVITAIQPPWNIIFNDQNAAKRRLLSKEKKVPQKQDRATSQYLGVSKLLKPYGGKRSPEKYYRAWCRVGKDTKKHIGCYITEIEAALARDEFIRQHNITNQPLNFP